MRERRRFTGVPGQSRERAGGTGEIAVPAKEASWCRRNQGAPLNNMVRKRNAGEGGSLFERANGRWRVQLGAETNERKFE